MVHKKERAGESELKDARGNGNGVKTCVIFFFNDTATTEIYTLSLHDALPISDQTITGRGKEEVT